MRSVRCACICQVLQVRRGIRLHKLARQAACDKCVSTSQISFKTSATNRPIGVTELLGFFLSNAFAHSVACGCPLSLSGFDPYMQLRGTRQGDLILIPCPSQV